MLICIVNNYLLLFFYGIQVSENKEELKTKLNKLLRDKNDTFNSENPEEDKVRKYIFCLSLEVVGVIVLGNNVMFSIIIDQYNWCIWMSRLKLVIQLGD